MYAFRNEETGEIITVDFDTMMNAKDGYLERPDGSVFKRMSGGNSKTSTTAGGGEPQGRIKEHKKIVSDSLGFGKHQLADMEQDRLANGIKGVEFRPDPDVPEFFQVHCDSEQAKSRYMAHRGFHDHNTVNGSAGMVDAKQLESAKELVLREYGSGSSQKQSVVDMI